MNLTIWHYIRIVILILDVVGIIFYYYYVTVEVYNFSEGTGYQYLGYCRIRKKRGDWYLKISKKMVENSVTTKYMIISVSGFHKLRKGEKMYIDFAGKYRTEVKVSGRIIVQNYLSTIHYL